MISAPLNTFQKKSNIISASLKLNFANINPNSVKWKMIFRPGQSCGICYLWSRWIDALKDLLFYRYFINQIIPALDENTGDDKTEADNRCRKDFLADEDVDEDKRQERREVYQNAYMGGGGRQFKRGQP